MGENERENEHKRAVPPAMPTPVVVHVYDVSTKEAIARINSVTKPLGGVFHAGVEVLGREWSYGYCPPPGTGVFCVPPRSCEAHVYRESIALGACALDAPAVARVIARLQSEWIGESYDLLYRNCVHFCDALCVALGVGALPGWVNRFANGGAAVQDGASAVVEGTAHAWQATQQTALQLDEKYALREKAAAAREVAERRAREGAARARELDDEFKVSESAAAIAGAARARAALLDDEYKVSETAAAHAAALDERYEIRRHAAEATAAAAFGLRAGASWLKATFGAERSLPAPPAVAVPEGVFDETGEEVFVPPPRAPPAALPAVAVPQDLFDESGEEVVALPPRGLARPPRAPREENSLAHDQQGAEDS